MNLDKRSEIIIFESNLTTFKLGVIFKAVGVVVKNCRKPNHYKEI
jgi:hypothetical protein